MRRIGAATGALAVGALVTVTAALAVQPGDLATDRRAFATEASQAANLALAKTVDDPTPNVGDTITFTVTLSDLGPDAATSVTVNDALPAGLFFLSATPSQGIYAPMSGLWQVGTVTTVGPQTLTLKARVDATTARTNTASISQSDQFDPDTNNNSASATETPMPTAVTFASANASRSSRGVVLRWRMASEVELLGFHVYRSRRHSWRRITHSLIAATGSVSGASYRWLDGGAKRGVVYHYRIKAVLRDGTAAWLGSLPVRSP